MKRKTRILWVLFIVLLVLIGTDLGFRAKYYKRIYPNVFVAGVNVGGETYDEAELKIEQQIKQLQTVTFKWKANEWEVQAEDLGIDFDIDQTLINTLEWGRTGNYFEQVRTIIDTLINTANIEVVHGESENQLINTLSTIANQINVPAMEPEISFDVSSNTVGVSAGENGQEVDESELLKKTREWVKSSVNTPIEIPVKELRPKLNEDELIKTKARAENLINRSIVVEFDPDKQKWNIGREQLLVWLDPQSDGWKRGEIESWVAELAHSVDRSAQNATVRIGVSGKVEEFKPAKDGYQIKQSEVVDRLIGELKNLESSSETEVKILLSTLVVKPDIQTGDVNNLGINELLGKGESWYAGSITNRIFNLKKAADLLNGTLIAPGDTFSFNKTVGEISSATGYKSAYIIKEGKTILGDGGGVCQTSSTLFRAVLAAGLPVEERTAHAYRVSYYEQNYQPGFDATVFQPAPDFKFKNDTQGYLLIQMEFDEKKRYLSFSLYGTSDGRKSEISKARVWDVTPPPPDLYIDDPNLPAGQVTQTEHRANGAKVAFDWKVTRNGEVLTERTFFSSYRPWQAVYLRGTKTN